LLASYKLKIDYDMPLGPDKTEEEQEEIDQLIRSPLALGGDGIISTAERLHTSFVGGLCGRSIAYTSRGIQRVLQWQREVGLKYFLRTSRLNT